jgi:hypothetical protein
MQRMEHTTNLQVFHKTVLEKLGIVIIRKRVN